MHRWKAAKRHKILKPFAWIYQIGHIIRTFAKHKMTPKKIIDQHEHGMEQRELIQKLGLRIDRNLQ